MDDRRRRIMALWLFSVAGMIFVMIVLGGLTRLTHSGLSMVEWRPLTGWLPPLSESVWQEVFAAYQQSPEYRKVNFGMTLAEFKGIFWLEYVHRLWGRLIGVVFFVPMLVFLVRGWVDRSLGASLFGLLLLGAAQGGLGWLMVMSGLVDRPDVSQYRLVAHLGLALVIYGAIVWTALGLLAPAAAGEEVGRVRSSVAVAMALAFVTMLSGGFVAGTDAGFAYNTFPLMDGELVPGHLFGMTPFYLSFFEDVTTVQFTHRVLALVTLTAVAVVWLRARGAALAPRSRLAVHVLAAATLVQVGLGIATVVLVVPVPVAAAHQAAAIVLLTSAVWSLYEVTPMARRVPAGATLGRVSAF